MKKFALILIGLFSSALFFGQSFGEVQGKILDDKGNPIAFANVWVEQGSKKVSTQTDYDGKYKIKPLNSGSYTLFVSYVGSQSITTQVDVNPDEITFINDLKMTQVTTIGGDKGPPIVVGRTIKLINPEETSKKSINMDDFKHSPSAKNITGMVSVISPAVKQAPDGSGLTFKGSRTGANVYFIDGMKIMGQTLPNIPSSGIKRMTVYTGGVPAKYGDATGGIVVIETKDYFSEYNKRKYSNK